MDGITVSLITAAVVGWLAAALGWFKWLHELGEKRREQTAKRAAEAELALMRRRSLVESPYFSLYDEMMGMLMFPYDGTGQPRFLLDGSPGLLSSRTKEAGPEAAEDGWIFLPLKNGGQRAQEITVTLDREPIEFINFEEHDGQIKIPAFCYQYQPAKHGAEQTLEVRFLSVSGARDTHRYLTKHGIRFLRRIDPE